VHPFNPVTVLPAAAWLVDVTCQIRTIRRHRPACPWSRWPSAAGCRQAADINLTWL